MGGSEREEEEKGEKRGEERAEDRDEGELLGGSNLSGINTTFHESKAFYLTLSFSFSFLTHVIPSLRQGLM